jgi:cytochrome c-type protein NapB
MKSYERVLIAVGLALVLAACAQVEESVEDSQLGLSKTSVDSTPDPIVATSKAGMPGENETQEAYFPGAPPVIPHQVRELLPITAQENMCLGCHDLPDQIALERSIGEPTPMPETHYTDLRRRPDTVERASIGARYVCTQCHAPQADAPPLVANTYRQ